MSEQPAVPWPVRDLTGIVLAGGAGRRMGRPKAFLAFRGQPLVSRIVAGLRSACDDLIIVTTPAVLQLETAARLIGDSGLATPESVSRETWAWPEGVRLLTDDSAIGGQGPLSGIATGLAAAAHPWSVITSCDAPFVSVGLIHLLRSRSEGADVVVAERAGRLQPLPALYHRRVAAAVRSRVAEGQLRLMALLKDPGLRVNTIREPDWSGAGVPDITFTNINTPRDLEEAVRISYDLPISDPL